MNANKAVDSTAFPRHAFCSRFVRSQESPTGSRESTFCRRATQIKLEARLRPHMNEDTDYARLLRWRLLAAEERPVDPYGIATQAEGG